MFTNLKCYCICETKIRMKPFVAPEGAVDLDGTEDHRAGTGLATWAKRAIRWKDVWKQAIFSENPTDRLCHKLSVILDCFHPGH